MKKRALQITIAGLLTACVTSACQTNGAAVKTVSIEEARKISTEFEDLSLVPPPRTVTDILDIIHQNQPLAEARRREWLKVADSSPPQNSSPEETARFFLERAAVRGYLGQLKEQLNDLESAEEAARGNRRMLADVYQLEGVAHVHGGNYRLGLEARRRGLSLLDPQEDGGALLNRNAGLGFFEARLGDFESADRRLAEARRWESTIPRWTDQRWAGWSRSGLRLGEAGVNLRRGNNVEAENLARQAIAIIERDIESGVDAQGIGFGLRNLLRWAVGSATAYWHRLSCIRDG